MELTLLSLDLSTDGCECGRPLHNNTNATPFCDRVGCQYQAARDMDAVDEYFDNHVFCWRDNPTCVCQNDTIDVVEFTLDDVTERYGY